MDDDIQKLCRGYLTKLRTLANRHGLSKWINKKIRDNKNGKCVATEEECEILSRVLDDERIARHDMPKLLGKSYRQCVDCDDFAKIRKLKRVGIYSKVSALLFKRKNLKNINENNNNKD